MPRIVNIVPISRIRSAKAEGYAAVIEHTVMLTTYIKGDPENRVPENEQKAMTEAIEAFDELMEFWQSGKLDEAISEARETRKLNDLDGKADD